MTAAFRFDAILQLRRRQRDEAALALSKVHVAVDKLGDERREIASQRKSLSRAQEKMQRKIISAHELKTLVDYDLALQHAAASLLERDKKIQAELESVRGRLVVAQQEVARLEKLELISESRAKKSVQRRERNEADTVIAARFTK
jgi:flagellar export protein FliJ